MDLPDSARPARMLEAEELKALEVDGVVCARGLLDQQTIEALRFALEDAIEEGSFKVKTGHVGRMVWEESTGWRVASWNQPPTAPLS